MTLDLEVVEKKTIMRFEPKIPSRSPGIPGTARAHRCLESCLPFLKFKERVSVART